MASSTHGQTVGTHGHLNPFHHIVLITGFIWGSSNLAAQAASLGRYSFDEVNQRFAASQIQAGLSFTDFRYRGSSIPRLISDSQGGQAYSARNWNRRGVSPDNYFEFTVTPDPSLSLDLERLAIDEWSGRSGPQIWELRSSLDDYGAAIAPPSPSSADPLQAGQTIALPDRFRALKTPVGFRFYAYDSRRTSGTWTVDNIRLNGTLQSLSQPLPTPIPISPAPTSPVPTPSAPIPPTPIPPAPISPVPMSPAVPTSQPQPSEVPESSVLPALGLLGCATLLRSRLQRRKQRGR